MPTELQSTAPAGDLALLDRSALESLPGHQALWLGGTSLAALGAAFTGLWTTQPELALAVAIGSGAGLVNPRKAWAFPLVLAATTMVGVGCQAAGIPAVIGAGAAAGGLATWLVPKRTDALDILHGSLGSLTGCALGLWAAVSLLPSALPVGVTALLTGLIVALLGSQGLLPVALRFDAFPQLPSRRQIRNALKVAYRPPVFRAIELYEASQGTAHDRDTKRGLAEVATWVFRLQATNQTLDNEIAQIDPSDVTSRIESCRAVPEDADPFTRERKQATAEHLERLLSHRKAIVTERGRTEAMVEYALAFLEEARAGLAVARELPGEDTPNRLPEVLQRLRNQAQEGDARRKTQRELRPLDV